MNICSRPLFSCRFGLSGSGAAGKGGIAPNIDDSQTNKKVFNEAAKYLFCGQAAKTVTVTLGLAISYTD